MIVTSNKRLAAEQSASQTETKQILALSSDRLRAAIEPLEEQETQYGSLQSQKKLRPLAFGPYWDGFIACVLMYVALAVPVEVAFLDVRTFSGNWWLSRVLDLVFIIDMIMSFNTPYYDESRVWVTDPYTVRMNYLKGWFFVDFISILPFDTVSSFSSNRATKKLRIVKTVKILRLLKMARMFRVSHLFAKWESSMEINYHRLSLAKFALVFLFASHWMACLWHMVSVMETLVNPNVVDSWVTAYNRQRRLPLNSAAELYITSLYWATVTMSTIGYGDVIPVTHFERVYIILATVVGGGLYAYLV